MNQVEIKRRQIQAVSVILTLITLTVAARLVGYNGLAYIAAAVEAFALLWLAVCGNLADSLGRLIRIRSFKGQHRNAGRLRRNVLIFQLVLGFLGSLILFAGADWLAQTVFKLQYSTFILMVLSPTVFFRTISTVLQGYFQGEGTELPAAVAAVLRQVFILGFGLLFGHMLSDYGAKVSKLLVQENFTSMYGGVGIAMAVSVSEIIILIFLVVIYRSGRKPPDRLRQEPVRVLDSFVDSVRILSAARSLLWVTDLLVFLPIPLGLIFLQKSAAADAAAEYGVYASGYLVLCGIWTALTLILLVPVCGRTLSCLRRDEPRFAKSVFQSGVHYGVVHAVFAAVFMAVMASQLAAVICPGQVRVAERMIRGGSAAILFLVLSLYFGRLLILLGGKVLLLGAVGAADVMYAVTLAVFLNAGNAGALALVYAGLLGLGLLCILSGVMTYRQMRVRIDWLQICVIPAGAAAVTGLLCMLLGRVFTSHLGEPVTLIITLVLGFCLYWVLLVLLKNFREQELEVLPGGRFIRALGQMLRVF